MKQAFPVLILILAPIEMEAKKNWTRQWWYKPKPHTTLVTGFPVIVELLELPHLEKCQQPLESISTLPLLEYMVKISEVIDVYLSHQLMPRQTMGDAAHLAVVKEYRG